MVSFLLTGAEFHLTSTLSDNVISVHDLTVYNLPLLCTVTQTKGATAFDLDLKVCHVKAIELYSHSSTTIDVLSPADYSGEISSTVVKIVFIEG